MHWKVLYSYIEYFSLALLIKCISGMFLYFFLCKTLEARGGYKRTNSLATPIQRSAADVLMVMFKQVLNVWKGSQCSNIGIQASA